jgi:ribonuclease HI
MGESPTLRVHTDGASRGNPGAAAFAYVISRDGEPPIEEAGCLGEMTNNQAEYIALIRALEHALELGAQHSLLIHSDSELLVKQMNGQYRVKNEELRGLYEEAQELGKRFTGGVTIRHVRRAQNSRADELCNEALDGKRSARSPQPKTATPAVSLREQALDYLRSAATAWRHGAEGPPIEKMWDELLGLLEKQGVQLPSDLR